MSLILAIDNDKKQSAQLASLLRAQVEADLVQTVSVAEGLAILGDRVPDLILTSTFLSPRDETALAGYLRELGAHGGHVQTLAIPVLATGPAPAKKKKSGVLGALRRDKTSKSLLEGADPAGFAKVVQQYLDRGVERRAVLAAEAVETAVSPWGPSSETELTGPMPADAVVDDFAPVIVATDSVAADAVFAGTVVAERIVATTIFAETVKIEAPAAVAAVALDASPFLLTTEPTEQPTGLTLLRQPDAEPAAEVSGVPSFFLLAETPATHEPTNWPLMMPPTAEPTTASLIAEAPTMLVAPLIVEAKASTKRAAAERAEAQRVAAERAEAERVAAERAEAERVAAERAAAERVAAERAEAERVAAERAAAERAEAERVAAERAAAERAEAERVAAERAAAERAEAERVAAERAAAERVAAERAEAKRVAAERAAAERAEAERVAAERAAAERAEAERVAAERAAAERAEAERVAAERAAAERVAAERAEAKRVAAERAAAERAEAERVAAERAAAERAEAERVAAERAAAERAEAERVAAERAAAERAEAERVAAERAAAERAEAERVAAERAAAERAEAKRVAAERAAAERAEAERAEAERVAAERTEAKRVAAERAAAERAEAERIAAERAEAERVAAERAAAERAEAERVAAERAEAERVAAERAAAERAEAKRVAAERAAAERAEAERVAAERAAAECAEAAAAPHLSGPGDLYVDEPDVDLGPAASAAQLAEDHVPVVDMARPGDLDALSRQMEAGQSLFVPEAVVPEVPAAVFLKDMPPLDPSIFADVPEAVAAPLIDQPYAGLAFEDIFLSAKDRKRAVAAAPQANATSDVTAALVQASPEVMAEAALEPTALEVTPIEAAAVEPPDAVASPDSPASPEAGAAAPVAPVLFVEDVAPPSPIVEPPAQVAEASASPAWSWMDGEASRPLADIFAAVVRSSDGRETPSVVATPSETAPAPPAAEAAPTLRTAVPAAAQIAKWTAVAPIAIDTIDAIQASQTARDDVAEFVTTQAVMEPAAEAIAAPTPLAAAPVAVGPVAPVVHEVFNPEAAASWNAAVGLGAPAEPVPATPIAAEPVAFVPALVPSTPSTAGPAEVYDPVRAAAWRSAMTGHVEAVAPRAVAPVPAVPDTAEVEAPRQVGEWGEDVGPTLGEEFLALIGNAARQASLDAFDALDETAAPVPARESRQPARTRQTSRTRRSKQAPRRPKPRPVQDEWGMFDPEQCGPDALFDEQAWEDEPDNRPSRRRGRTAA